MNIQLDAEQEADHQQIFEVNRRAFNQPDEGQLVNKIRSGANFVPELSLVAKYDVKVIGHILFSKISILTGDSEFETLALAPVAVDPDYQKMGVGKKLIEAGLQKAGQLGFESVIVLGHPDYYPKFGFEPASKWRITCPFEAPDNAFMGVELKPGALGSKPGVVRYPVEFGEL